MEEGLIHLLTILDRLAHCLPVFSASSFIHFFGTYRQHDCFSAPSLTAVSIAVEAISNAIEFSVSTAKSGIITGLATDTGKLRAVREVERLEVSQLVVFGGSGNFE